MELIKTQLIDDLNSPKDKRKYRGVFHGTRRIILEQGVVSLYKGLTATILKQGSNQAVRFVVFEEAKKFIQSKKSNVKLGVAETLLCGGFAGFVSVMVNNPFDVVKTKMQGLEASKFKGFFDCFRWILTNQGPLFFYRGVTPRLLRVIGDSAVVFTVVDRLKGFIEKNLFN